MKFLLISNSSSSLLGFRLPLIKSLLDKKIEVHVAAPDVSPDSEAYYALTRLGIAVHEIPLKRTGMNPFLDFYTLFFMWRLMRRIKPYMVMGYTVKPVIYGSLAAMLAMVPRRFALITGLGFSFIEDQSGRRNILLYVVKFLYRISLKFCDVIFFQNRDDEALFLKLQIIMEESKTCVVNGSGVDLEEFEFVETSMSTTARFIFVGRLLGDKGIREYAKAAKAVKQLYPDVIFDVVGSLDKNPDSILKSELDLWINEGFVNYLGYLKDVRPAIRNANVFVLPSYREGTPRSTLEAMSMGRAVITTDAPGCRETVFEGVNGYLVPVKDVQSLESAMLNFINNPDLIVTMGKASREIATEKFDVNQVNSIMLKRIGVD